jgi:hypothetical protein
LPGETGFEHGLEPAFDSLNRQIAKGRSSCDFPASTSIQLDENRE